MFDLIHSNQQCIYVSEYMYVPLSHILYQGRQIIQYVDYLPFIWAVADSHKLGATRVFLADMQTSQRYNSDGMGIFRCLSMEANHLVFQVDHHRQVARQVSPRVVAQPVRKLTSRDGPAKLVWKYSRKGKLH